MVKQVTSLSIIALLFCACGTSNENTSEWKQKAPNDSVFTIEPKHLAVKSADQLTDAKGIIGIFDVPEMLTVLKMDSASISKIATKMANTYRVIQQDIKLTKAEINGSAGVLYYNSDTSNFVFECVIPISQVPKKEPKNSQIVALENAQMLVYNYYGSYINLNTAYKAMNDFCTQNKLKQIGPMREFYITDPTVVKDTSQWLTRIMLPVKQN